jgi:CRP-like cAMP-binding protein
MSGGDSRPPTASPGVAPSRHEGTTHFASREDCTTVGRADPSGTDDMTTKQVNPDEIRGLPLFAGLDEEQLNLIARHTGVVELRRGQPLFRNGDPAVNFFYLQRGQLKLTRSSFDGDEKVISVVRAGQTFAEAALFMESAGGYPVSAIGIEESRVLALPGEVIKKLLRNSPETCFRVMAVMSVRLRELVLQIDELTLHNATHRLASYLLSRLPDGANSEPGSDIRLVTPKVVIASRLSIQPETFSRILARLRDEGLVASEGSSIVVKDVTGLRRLVQP